MHFTIYQEGDLVRLRLVRNKYLNGRLAVQVTDDYGAYRNVSVDMPEVDLASDEFIFNYAENEEMYGGLTALGAIETTGRAVDPGLPICRLHCD